MSTRNLTLLSMLLYFYSIDKAVFLTDFTHNAYNVVFERLQLVWFDRAVYENYKIVTYKYNRTVATYNLTMTLRSDKPAFKIAFRCFKFLNNEYKLTAIQFEINGCALIKLGKFGTKILKTNSNFTDPIKKGTYSMYNAYFDSSTFPPHFPEGKWKIQTSEVINGAISVKLDCYLQVVYPVKYGRK